MIEYRWREEGSESFGKVKRPVAEVHIKDKNGQWRAITMLVDSGADVSIISKSYGELFGHNLKKGRKIRLKGIGEDEVLAYLHKMEMLIGKHEVNLEVAIASVDLKVNVLGRMDIFSLFEIQFKNLKECTRFVRRKKK